MKKLLFAFVFTIIGTQAMALEFGMGPVKGNLYGQLYLSGFYEEQNKDYVNYSKGTDFLDSKSAFNVALEGRSRLGVDLSFGNLTGVFELGANIDNYLRLYYIQYDFGKAGYVLFGQNTSIASYSFGQEALEGNSLIGYGAVDDARRPMLMYGIAGFQISVVHSGNDPINDADDYNEERDPITGELVAVYEKNIYVPRIEVAYTYANDFIEAKIYGSYAYNSYKEYYRPTDEKRILNQSSWLGGVGATYNIYDGYIAVGGFYGINLYNTGALPSDSLNLSPMASFFALGTLDDIRSWGVEVGIGYTFAEKFTPQLGFGYQSSSSDIWDKDDEAMGAYFNVICQLNQYIALIPEVSYLDDMKDGFGNKEGARLFAGVIAKITF